jgi:hypothetical protein
MARNVYFSHGTKNEQFLIEDIIVESLAIYGQDFYYIPRTLVSKDNILGEDRLSEFKTAYPIEMYLENSDGFEGQGAFMQKFGLMVEQTATLTMARRRWEQLVGRWGQTILPNRPCEGDLLYFPLSKGLFEIKFVQHQDPFYQLGKLYVYKLQVELFQYSSERIDTGVEEIDAFETLKTFTTDTTRSQYGEVLSINVTSRGSDYTTTPTVTISGGGGTGATAQAVLGTGVNANKVVSVVVTNGGAGYETLPTVTITGNAKAVAIVGTIIDNVDSFGDNNSFKQEGSNYILNESNPFGDVSNYIMPSVTPAPVYLTTADSIAYTADRSITADAG